MDGGVTRKYACTARVHVWTVDGRYIRRKCTDRRCPEARWAKQHDQIAIHVWDQQSDVMWTEYEPKESQHGRNSYLQP
jgi:hypothetical protein